MGVDMMNIKKKNLGAAAVAGEVSIFGFLEGFNMACTKWKFETEL